MSKTILITVIFAVLFLFGFAREMKLNAQQDSSSGNKKTCLDAADEYLRLNPERVSNKNELSKVLCFYDEVMRKNPSDLETVRRIRDAIVNYVKNSIDANYDKYADELYKNRNQQSISSSVLDYVTGIDLTTKPDLIPGSSCEADCFLSSITSDLTNKKPSKELSVEILLLAMEISRTQVAAEIKEKLKLDVNDYPLEFARRDLRNYFFAGTPIGAARGLGVMLERIKK